MPRGDMLPTERRLFQRLGDVSAQLAVKSRECELMHRTNEALLADLAAMRREIERHEERELWLANRVVYLETRCRQ